MNRLVTLTPFYSIEAWLFSAVDELRRIGVHAEVLAEWEANLASLDTLRKPKDRLSLDPRHYPGLARKLNAPALYQLESSLCATVNRAGACGSLVVRLRAHWPDWVRARYGF